MENIKTFNLYGVLGDHKKDRKKRAVLKRKQEKGSQRSWKKRGWC